MALHDWSKLPEWEGVHHLWISELYHEIKSKLPRGYRAGLATVPSLTIGLPSTHPDVSVQWEPTTGPFDTEVTVLAIDPSKQVRVLREGALVAVIELISPQNKDREKARKATVDRFIGYLALGVHVVFVDVHPAPLGFSLADAIAEALDYPQSPCPGLQAMAYRVGGPVDGGGRSLAIRRGLLSVGQPLPTTVLPLSEAVHVMVDLDATYSAATNEYLS